MLRRRSCGRRALQPAYARPRHGLLHSRRTARTASRHWLAPAARRCRLLSDLRLAVRAYGHRRRAALAAHDARAAGPGVPGRAYRLHPVRRPTARRATIWRSPISRSAADNSSDTGVDVADAGESPPLQSLRQAAPPGARRRGRRSRRHGSRDHRNRSLRAKTKRSSRRPQSRPGQAGGRESQLAQCRGAGRGKLAAERPQLAQAAASRRGQARRARRRSSLGSRHAPKRSSRPSETSWPRSPRRRT